MRRASPDLRLRRFDDLWLGTPYLKSGLPSIAWSAPTTDLADTGHRGPGAVADGDAERVHEPPLLGGTRGRSSGRLRALLLVVLEAERECTDTEPDPRRSADGPGELDVRRPIQEFLARNA